MTEKEKECIAEEERETIPPEAADPTPAGAEEQLQSALAAEQDRYLRLMAEYDNFRKRSAREKEDIYPAATAAAVEKFLPVMDSLERAAEFECGDQEFAKGFEMICQSLRDVFRDLGVEEIGEVGEPFDPSRHNAVMRIEDPELGENVVAQVLQKGYRIGERILRYAMVQTAN